MDIFLWDLLLKKRQFKLDLGVCGFCEINQIKLWEIKNIEIPEHWLEISRTPHEELLKWHDEKLKTEVRMLEAIH